MADAVVLYPASTIGHLISQVELAKLLLTHQSTLSVHILVPSEPYNAGKTDTYIATVSVAFPSIKFHHLPAVSTPPSITALHHETLIFEVLRLSNPLVLEELVSISKNYNVCAIIMDFFCTYALSLAMELNIPSYIYITSCASFLASYLYLPTIHRKTTKSLRYIKDFLDIPGLPPIRGCDLAKPFLDREDHSYRTFLDFASKIVQATGIIGNTFEELESQVIKTISGGLCVPDNRTPPLFCVGPLIAERSDSKSSSPDDLPECLTWLDSQPAQSVVFLSFGSLGVFSKVQLREIAIGLEKSGQRFLWVVRDPPQDVAVAIKGLGDFDLNSMLPDGFLERTKERGFVVKSWAPQVAILNHSSVAGFVTHCGWNSILEAVCAGVPLVAWPLYAEQRLNRIVLVEEMKLALSIDESEDGFVSADEVEKKVRGLIESEQGKSIGEKAIAMKIAAKAAMDEGGSSRLALSKLVESWKHDK